ncbi:hypothetical protein CkaCkLH20_10159 [Colletotrichum karsti]|uniref:Uncharacterized protein n=1 Tax=Colletotrichum karsti TaxID=1095194 RepID=A0A9P6HYA9_9PEZI|nr:uncharacterized protein CkaCkLH20_10159 [Colletotrichum karsti]KAF9872332.1 hypothetical protein CkaCkLH20_10159 [Colletotrichum karsti]
MRNPFRVKKQRQTWAGRPRALTLDDPVFQGWDEEELEFKPKYQKSDEDLQKTSAKTDGGDGAPISNEPSASHYNHDNTLGYAPIAGAFSGGEAAGSSSASAPDHGSADTACATQNTGDGGDGSTCH